MIRTTHKIESLMDPIEVTDKNSDPKVWGPGAWFTMHVYARNSTTPEAKKSFINYCRIIISNLKCEKCRAHALDYLNQHPIDDFLNIKSNDGADIGMFKWTWMFHNAVNSRLGKPIFDWDTAYVMYSDTNYGICQKSCGEDTTSNVSNKSEPPTPTIGVTANTRLPVGYSEKTILNGGVVYSQKKPSQILSMSKTNIPPIGLHITPKNI